VPCHMNGISIPPLPHLPALTTRTALLMPIYNEIPQRIFAGLQAIYASLENMGALGPFDFFILSDTTDPDIWIEEERGFSALRQQTRGERRIFYRHRSKNMRRKAGRSSGFLPAAPNMPCSTYSGDMQKFPSSGKDEEGPSPHPLS
jgi:membrane glycosyltransferase